MRQIDFLFLTPERIKTFFFGKFEEVERIQALIWEIFRREENIKTLTWELFSRILRQIRLRALYTAKECQVKAFIQNFKKLIKWLGFQILLFWWQNDIILRFTRFLWIHMNLQQFMVSWGRVWRHTTSDLKFKHKVYFNQQLFCFLFIYSHIAMLHIWDKKDENHIYAKQNVKYLQWWWLWWWLTP